MRGRGLLGEVTVQGSDEGEDYQLMEAGKVKNRGEERGLITLSSEEKNILWPLSSFSLLVQISN